MKELTDRQREVFNFLREYYHEHGFSPTIYEIGDRFGFTPAAGWQHLNALEKKGFVSRESYCSRTLLLTKDYVLLKVSGTCPESRFRVGDRLIVCRTTRPVAGDGVVVESGDVIRIEAFQGQKPILGKVLGLCREV